METRSLSGNLVVLGLGSVGSAFLHMAERHLRIEGLRIAVSADEAQSTVAERHGYAVSVVTLTSSNFREILSPFLVPGSLLVNLCIEVSSQDLMLLCREKDTLYVDTVTDPWPGIYGNRNLDMWSRSNACLRHEVRTRLAGPGATAICTHGANPGWVSHLVKQALLELAAILGEESSCPSRREEWARLACTIGLRTLQIAERDLQKACIDIPADAIANTWSVDGFVAEAFGQAGEVGWGSHEGDPPRAAELRHGVLLLPEFLGPYEVKSWTPLSGEHDAMIVTHAESLTLADYLTVSGPSPYRPTVYYAYRPIDEAWRTRRWPQSRFLALPNENKIVLRRDQIDDGIDELGVLLLGERFGAYWIGSTLSSAQADIVLPGFSATAVQVVAGVLAAVIIALDEPWRGYLEPEDLDHEKALRICRPYLGSIVSIRSDWYPANTLHDYRFERFLPSGKF